MLNGIGNIKKIWLVMATLLFCSQQVHAARYANTSGTNARSLMPDGSAITDFVTNPTAVSGSSTWFSFQTAVNHSYMIELVNTSALNGVNANRFNVEFFDNNGNTFTGVAENTCNPGAFEFNPPTWRRYAVKVIAVQGSNGYMRIKVSNGLNYTPSQDMPFQLRIYDTTLGATRWSINGVNSAVELHNMNPSCQISATIVYRGNNGAIIATRNAAIVAKGSAQVGVKANEASFSQKNGSVEVFHNGMPGDLIGDVTAAKPNSDFIQQWPLEQVRAYGKGALD